MDSPRRYHSEDDNPFEPGTEDHNAYVALKRPVEQALDAMLREVVGDTRYNWEYKKEYTKGFINQFRLRFGEDQLALTLEKWLDRVCKECIDGKTNGLELIIYALEQGAPATRDALHVAFSTADNPQLLELLLDQKPELLETVLKGSCNAMAAVCLNQEATDKGRLELAQLLRDRGVPSYKTAPEQYEGTLHNLSWSQVALAKFLIEECGVPVDLLDQNKDTLLDKLAKGKDDGLCCESESNVLEMLHYLESKGALIHAAQGQLASLFEPALRAGFATVAQWIRNQGIDLKLSVPRRLAAALRSGNPKLVQMEFTNDPPPTIQEAWTSFVDGLTWETDWEGKCLMERVIQAAEPLLEAGTITPNGTSALAKASSVLATWAVRTLLKNGGDPTVGCLAPVAAHPQVARWGTHETRLDLVKLLLDHGAKANNLAQSGVFFRLLRCRTWDMELFFRLLDQVKDIQTIKHDNGNTLLHEAIRLLDGTVSRSQVTELLNRLLDRIDNINTLGGPWGKTLLHECVLLSPDWDGMDRILWLLVNQRGADINLANDEGDTPLHVSVRNPSSGPMVWLLLELGASTTKRNKQGKTPLDCCIDQPSRSRRANQEGSTQGFAQLLQQHEKNRKMIAKRTLLLEGDRDTGTSVLSIVAGSDVALVEKIVDFMGPPDGKTLAALTSYVGIAEPDPVKPVNPPRRRILKARRPKPDAKKLLFSTGASQPQRPPP